MNTLGYLAGSIAQAGNARLVQRIWDSIQLLSGIDWVEVQFSPVHFVVKSNARERQAMGAAAKSQ